MTLEVSRSGQRLAHLLRRAQGTTQAGRGSAEGAREAGVHYPDACARGVSSMRLLERL
jgi:hypothetical protein